ncbi:MAG: M56 family metallopeptidase [Deltaproteobacteria bacterium]|nr:M56 family metallopeptidase [Deltaproteobacteria bacterium]
MALSSLVAFGVVFVGASLVLSVLFNLVLLACTPALRRLGPWVERRAAASAIILPPVIAIGLVAVLAVGSALAILRGSDHCLDHSHHLHLCLKHGMAWASRPWALCLVISLATFVAVRSALSAWAHWGAQRAAARLRAVGAPIDQTGCYLVPSQERFAFTAGLLSPTVVVSSAAWHALDSDERDAVLAHELAHVAHGDLRLRAILGLAAALGFPFLVNRTLRLWELSAERICDRRAALAVQRPSTVASAMLALVRAAPPKLAPEGAIFAAACHVPERVESVLREEPDGERPSRRLMAATVLAAVAVTATCGLFSEPIHHILETILG